jgi:hypothetical protein
MFLHVCIVRVCVYIYVYKFLLKIFLKCLLLLLENTYFLFLEVFKSSQLIFVL